MTAPHSRPPHSWSEDVFAAMRARDIKTVATIPDGGLTKLLQMCEADAAMRVVTLSTEEEGIGVVTGLHLARFIHRVV